MYQNHDHLYYIQLCHVSEHLNETITLKACHVSVEGCDDPSSERVVALCLLTRPRICFISVDSELSGHELMTTNISQLNTVDITATAGT